MKYLNHQTEIIHVNSPFVIMKLFIHSFFLVLCSCFLYSSLSFFSVTCSVTLGPWQTLYFTGAETNSTNYARLTQLRSNDLIWSVWGVFAPGQPWITSEDRLWVNRRSLIIRAKRLIKGLKAPCWLNWPRPLSLVIYQFGVDRFDWIEFDVWLKQAFF